MAIRADSFYIAADKHSARINTYGRDFLASMMMTAKPPSTKHAGKMRGYAALLRYSFRGRSDELAISISMVPDEGDFIKSKTKWFANDIYSPSHKHAMLAAI